MCIYPITRKEARDLESKFYMTGLPCSKGHVSERRTTTGQCRSCEKIPNPNSKEYYQRNKDKIKNAVARYKSENKEKVLTAKRKNYQNNKETISKKQAIYRSENKELIAKRNKEQYYRMSEEKKISERKRLREYNSKKYWENPEKLRELGRKYHHKNRIDILRKLAEWKEQNPNWYKEYRQLPHAKEKARFFASRRRAIKIQAMPLWANQDLIELIYATCPDGMHVDHIVPLVSKFVCGLHCEANLQHLPAKENFSKNNHWWPDMP